MAHFGITFKLLIGESHIELTGDWHIQGVGRKNTCRFVLVKHRRSDCLLGVALIRFADRLVRFGLEQPIDNLKGLFYVYFLAAVRLLRLNDRLAKLLLFIFEFVQELLVLLDDL